MTLSSLVIIVSMYLRVFDAVDAVVKVEDADYAYCVG